VIFEGHFSRPVSRNAAYICLDLITTIRGHARCYIFTYLSEWIVHDHFYWTHLNTVQSCRRSCTCMLNRL